MTIFTFGASAFYQTTVRRLKSAFFWNKNGVKLTGLVENSVGVSSRHVRIRKLSENFIKEIGVAGYPLKICGFADDPYFNSIETHMSANNFLGAVMKHHVSANSIMIDVGANIGVTSALAAAVIPGVRVIAIEPSSRAFECLLRTLNENNVNADPIRACVGREDGKAAFFEMDFLAGSHIVAADHPTIHNAAATTTMTRLDTLVELKGLDRLDLIKIDVEGFESDVLFGMERLDVIFQPLVFMEFNIFTITAYRNMSPRALLDQIRAKYGQVFYKEGDQLTCATTDGDFLKLIHDTIVKYTGTIDLLFTASDDRRRALIG